MVDAAGSSTTLQGQLVEIGRRQYQLTPVSQPQPSGPGSQQRAPGSIEQTPHQATPTHTASDDSAAEQNQSPKDTIPVPSTVKLSAQSIRNAETENVLYNITMGSKSEWSLSSKSLVTVTSNDTGKLLGTLHFHSFEDDLITVNPANAKSFELRENESDTEWLCKGFAGNLRWRDIDAGITSLIYDKEGGGVTEVARLNGAELRFFKNDGGWIWNDTGEVDSFILSGLAMKEEKRRNGEEGAMASQFADGLVQGALAGLGGGS